MSVYNYIMEHKNNAQKSVASLHEIDEDMNRLDHWIQLLAIETAKYVSYNASGEPRVLDQHRLNEVNNLISELEGIRSNNRSVRAEFIELVDQIERNTRQSIRGLEDIRFRCDRIGVFLGRRMLKLASDLSRVISEKARICKRHEDIPRGADLLMTDEVRQVLEAYDHEVGELKEKFHEWQNYRAIAEKIFERYTKVPLPPVVDLNGAQL